MPRVQKTAAAKGADVASVLPRTAEPPTGSLAAYEHFLPLAQAIPQAEVQSLREKTAIVYQNVVMGVRAVLKEEAEVRKLPLKLPLKQLSELPELALALRFAASQVNTRSSGELQGLRSQVSKLRRLLLSAAETLVLSGDLQARDVEQIRRGSGPLDAGQDCVALAALFKAHAEARKKTPVTAEHIEQAEELGTRLLSLLRPGGARQPSQGQASAEESVAIRDRLWTLLSQRHRELRRIGMWLFLDEAGDRVPGLRSRTRRAPRPRTDKPPQPGSG